MARLESWKYVLHNDDETFRHYVELKEMVNSIFILQHLQTVTTYIYRTSVRTQSCEPRAM